MAQYSKVFGFGSSEASASGSATPIKTRQISELYSAPVVDTLTINCEHTISVRTFDNADWGLQRLEELHLGALFFISDLVYPRLVRQFYQNLTTGSLSSGGSLSVYTHIDGFKINLSRTSIARALGMMSVPLGIQSPAYAFEEVVQELCGRFPRCKNSVRRVHLPERMWLVDRILQLTIFPIGDKKFKSKRTLQALMAISKDGRFDFGDSIFQDICFIKKDIREHGHKTRMLLEFPRIITRIILDSGFVIAPTELNMSQFQVLESSDWKKTYRQLNTRLKIELRIHNRGKGVIQTSTSPTQLLRLEHSLFVISQKQDHILRIQKDLANASIHQNHQLFQLEAILFGLVAEQTPEAMGRLIDRMTEANRSYTAPNFDLNVDIQEPLLEIDSEEEEEGESDEDNI